MVGWHHLIQGEGQQHQLNGQESEQTSGDGEGQGSLARCSPGGRKESDMTEGLNNRSKESSACEEHRTLAPGG